MIKLEELRTGDEFQIVESGKRYRKGELFNFDTVEKTNSYFCDIVGEMGCAIFTGNLEIITKKTK